MWNRIKNTFKAVETRRRSQRELDHLFGRTDHVLRDVGVQPEDILRKKKALYYL